MREIKSTAAEMQTSGRCWKTDSLLNDDPHIRNDYVSRRRVLSHRQAGAARLYYCYTAVRGKRIIRRGVWQVMARIAADTSE